MFWIKINEANELQTQNSTENGGDGHAMGRQRQSRCRVTREELCDVWPDNFFAVIETSWVLIWWWWLSSTIEKKKSMMGIVNLWIVKIVTGARVCLCIKLQPEVVFRRPRVLHKGTRVSKWPIAAALSLQLQGDRFEIHWDTMPYI